MNEQPADNEQVIVLSKPKRKNSDRVSGWRNLTDMLFGVIAPILCLIFDPIVFRGGFYADGDFSSPSVGQWRVFAYLSIGLGIAVFTHWLWNGRQPAKWAGGYLTVFLCGAVIAALIGVAILPLSVVGILYAGVGLLGFIPFITALIYFRSAMDALRQSDAQLTTNQLVHQFFAGIALVMIIPLAAQFATNAYTRSAVDDILRSNSMTEAQPAIERLDRAFWCQMECYEPIDSALRMHTNPDRTAYLESVLTHFQSQTLSRDVW